MTTKQSKEKMALRMRRSFDFLFFCLFIFHVNGQPLLSLPQGSINLDCGLNKEEPTYVNYTDDVSIPYIPDDQFVENGIKEEVDILPPNGFNLNLLSTKRTFRGENGTRGCYTFNVTKGLSILLRAYFYFGGREGSSIPQFLVYLGVNYWTTIASSSNKVEIIHSPTSNYLHLCLLNIGLGEPYINYIELRSIGSTSPHIYNTSGLGSLVPMYGGCYLTVTDATQIIRYPVDKFDRLWKGYNMGADSYAVKSTTEDQVASRDDYYPPWKVVRSAILPINNDTKISWSYTVQENIKLYVVLHFTELQQNVTRYMNVTACNSYVCDVQQSLDPPEYLQASSYPFILTAPGVISFTISTSEQETPPILSATEDYTITPFKLTETNDGDVDAVRAIKDTYKDAFNAKVHWQWIGDPCLPQHLTWSGITCSYNGNEPPRITELNLSSCGLNGAIPQALANLTMLQKLDLSFNYLIGPVPDFLSSLQELRFISIEGNNMTGPWPSALLHRQGEGLILKGTFQSHLDAPHQLSYSHGVVNVGVIIAISLSIMGALICIPLVVFLVFKFRSKQSKQESGITPKLRPLTISEVNNLIHDKRVLGQGGFGAVYLSSMDGNYVAVKILDECNEQMARDFKSEVEILATVHHKNLVRILGYCDHKTKRALVMEYVENNTLKHHLSAENPDGILSWDKRVRIIIGSAQGLEYLHHGCNPPIIHRDIKPENILLTQDFEAKLADFGFSRLLTSQYNPSRIVGTPGYLDPKYHELHEVADIYSFGIVLLVVVTGKRPILPGFTALPDWVKENVKRGDIHSIVDPHLNGKYDENMAWNIVEIAMKCTSMHHSERPSMEDIVKHLKSAMEYTTETSQSTCLFLSESSDIHGPKSR